MLNEAQFHLDCQEDQLKAGEKPGEPGFGIEPEERQGKFSRVNSGRFVNNHEVL